LGRGRKGIGKKEEGTKGENFERKVENRQDEKKKQIK
jgi:hypothetical protein